MKITWAVLWALLLPVAPAVVQAQFAYTTNGDAIVLNAYSGAGGDVTISNFVTDIGASAFAGWTSLTSATIPPSVASVGDSAFEGCTGLTNVTIPASVTSIGDSAFGGCAALSSATIPGNVNSQNVFWGCPMLQNATIADGVGSIAAFAFQFWSTLTNVTISGSVTNIGNHAFYRCTGLMSVGIPGSVISIGNSAFDGCASLESVTIGASVTNIGTNAFSSCNKLTTINVDPANAFFSSVAGVLFDVTAMTLIQYPGGLSGGYAIPAGVTNIGTYAFAYCGSLTSVAIPYGVISIGDLAFFECGSLADVTIPGSVVSIGEGAFGWTALTSVTIPPSTGSIGQSAFLGTGLTSVTIPAGVTNIGEGAFSGCAELTELTVDPANPVYNSVGGVLFDISQATLIQYPEGLSGSYAIPAGVTSIGNGAFSGCTLLTSVTMPGSVTSIGQSAFNGCTGLTSAAISGGVTSIGELAFSSCINLKRIMIPGSVTSIGDGAFQESTSLPNVYFEGNAPPGNNMHSIFYGDPYATVYYLPGTTGWAEFDANTGLTAVLWNPLIQTSDGNFGAQNSQFGFNITGTAGIPIVVEACTNLASPLWTPIQTNTLASGSWYFSEPLQTASPTRYYRVRSP